VELDTAHGTVPLPAFFPDGTRGVVRAVDAEDLHRVRVRGVVMNTLHLMATPGARVVRCAGGLHSFAGWKGPILTDSGGFQVWSLQREDSRLVTLRPNEVIFRQRDASGRPTRKIVLTPEKCIRTQCALGADILTCLDWCTHPDDPPGVVEQSVEATIRWAAACRKEYERQMDARPGRPCRERERRPLLFAIVQGGTDLAHRKRCAEALVEMGFDGYGFGGWPLDAEGVLLSDILAFTASLLPDHLPKYALGIGKPENIVACARMGFDLFDTVLPTRDARHKRLYVLNATSSEDIRLDSDFYTRLYMEDAQHVASDAPVSTACDCPLCRNYSRAYLAHLFRIGDPLAFRLATLHNLRFYTQLMEALGRSDERAGR
jgi:queuine tRNA-ribosyltransferase